jgi:hypothetical protein
MVQEFDLPMEIIDRKVRSAQDSSSTAPYSSRCLHNLQYKNSCPVVSHMRWWFCLMPALTQVACVCAFREQPSLAAGSTVAEGSTQPLWKHCLTVAVLCC